MVDYNSSPRRRQCNQSPVVSKRMANESTRQPRQCRKAKRRTGSIAEIPLVIFALFLVFAFPMINLGTTALRHSLFMYACRQGAFSAASAYTFGNGTAEKPAAVDIAPQKVASVISRFSGITMKSIDVSIVSVDLESGAVMKHNGKLTEPADTGKFLYFIELTAVADIYPITEVRLPFLDVAGLSRKWTSTVNVREFVESPQGLDD